MELAGQASDPRLRFRDANPGVRDVSSTSSSLVLGVVTRLPAAAVEPFVTSLRATSYRGSLHLFVGQMDKANVTSLRRMADLVVEVDDLFPSPGVLSERLLRRMRMQRGLRRLYPSAFAAAVLVSRSGNVAARWRSLEYRLEGLQALRYQLYRDHLSGPGSGADYVLLSDVRDVWFQGDPFEPAPQVLEVFLEDQSVKIGADVFNRRWIERLYGSSELERLAGFVVSCSGTVAGDCVSMRRYVTEMAAELRGRISPMSSHDQGAHNYLLRFGHLDPVTIVPNETGRVLTMGSMQSIMQAEGHVVNRDGSVPPVIHQYDRHAQITTELFGRLEDYRRR